MMDMSRLVDMVKNGLGYGMKALAGSPEERNHARTHLQRRMELAQLKGEAEISFERNGFRWTGPPYCTITRAIFIDGQHQDVIIPHLEKWMPPGRSVVVNVGANIGDTALPLSRTGKRVIAAEPSPETFARLQANVRNNHLEQVITCCQVAVSNEEGTAQMAVAAQPGNSELVGENGAVGFDGDDQRRDVISVPTMPLDRLLESLSIAPTDVALVWSDTQGFESQVIESAPQLWANGVPLWVEVWPKGLDCHGGTDRFIDVCTGIFSRFSMAGEMEQPPRPIAELKAKLLQPRDPNWSTDILMLP
jgi:FkbM family methyltransferase